MFLHTVDVSSDDDEEVPNDPLELVFLGNGVGLPPKTGLFIIEGDNALWIFAISEGLKFPLCEWDSKECGLLPVSGAGKWPKFCLVELSKEVLLPTFN